MSQDYTEAVRWYRRAAEQGDGRAQYSLGYMYANGQGVPRDYIEARCWFRKAAAQGYADARRALELRPTRSEEIGIILIATGFSAGLLLSLHFLLPGRKLREWRQVTITLLGLLLMLNAGLNLNDMEFSPYCAAFHVARRFLIVAAALIIVIVVLRSGRKQSKGETAADNRGLHSIEGPCC